MIYLVFFLISSVMYLSISNPGMSIGNTVEYSLSKQKIFTWKPDCKFMEVRTAKIILQGYGNPYDQSKMLSFETGSSCAFSFSSSFFVVT